jgi:hypothetical protein
MPRLNQHLNDVDESYFQHMQHALWFSAALLWASLCCLVHALLPFLCEKRGSQLVARLHDRMVVNRHELNKRPARSTKQLREQQDDTQLV